MRVALTYDRINKIGGAEQVLVAFSKLYPEADWYTSVWNPASAPFSHNWRVHTSWLSRIPLLRTRHEWIPWLMPFVFESFDFSAYDLVISVGSAEAKGIVTRPGTLHINYCLTPTRYLYSHQEMYLSNPLYRFIGHYLRKWDLVAATRPDMMIAISTQVKKRIQNIYKRKSEIIFPPVGTEKFTIKSTFTPTYRNYYLTVARLVSYKKIDILIQTFNQNGLPLVIVGKGAEFTRLKRLAKPNVHVIGAVSDTQLVGYYQHAVAFLHAGAEDFGISMCESLAAGIPVIAYADGGATDIIQDGITGILVKHQTPDAFNHAIKEARKLSFDPSLCKKSVERFKMNAWEQKIQNTIGALWQTSKK